MAAPPYTSPGYDDGYARCPCFWGSAPGTLVQRLEQVLPEVTGLNVLDAGCGEGKNAAYLAARGATVAAFDASEMALANGVAAFGQPTNLQWQIADVRELPIPTESYDIVIAYGLLHCLNSDNEVESVLQRLQAAVVRGGHMIVCAFNDRGHDLSAHPGFDPCLLSHQRYVSMFAGWELIECSDSDLVEAHPHNNIVHKHSITRVLARKTATGC